MIDSLGNINSIDALFESKLVLYGAGFQGKMVCRMLESAGISVSYFCDNDSQKWGYNIDGFEIISPKKLQQLDSEEAIVIIITTVHVAWINEIADTICKLNLKTNVIYTTFGLNVLLLQNIKDPRINSSFSDAFLISENHTWTTAFFNGGAIQLRYVLNLFLYNHDVLVYQPGKTGSTTITNSLYAAGVTNQHIHWITGSRLISHHCNETQKNMERLLSDKNLYALRQRNPIKIITLVREPISREYSLLFQYFDSHGIFTAMSKSNLSFVDSCNKWLSNRTVDKVYPQISGTLEQFSWFYDELMAVFGVDIFSYPFDREKGYSIIKQGNVEVLVMKLEKLNSLEQIIGDFVGVSHFKLINANEGGAKPSEYLYKNLRNVIKIPKKMVSFYYDNNRHMNHFYTENEKTEFLKKWENNIT